MDRRIGRWCCSITLPSEDSPSHLLDGYTGVLQTDGYAGYNKLCRKNPITRIGCWDDARPKFVEAGKADVALGKTRKLNAIETRTRIWRPIPIFAMCSRAS